MQRWEYLFVTCVLERDEWKAMYVNGQEVRDWKRGPNLAEWSNERGAEGWELVSSTFAVGSVPIGMIMDMDYRLIFKRPR